MPITAHIKKYFTSTDFVQDVLIGMTDGSAFPFELAAGEVFVTAKLLS